MSNEIIGRTIVSETKTLALHWALLCFMISFKYPIIGIGLLLAPKTELDLSGIMFLSWILVNFAGREDTYVAATVW